MKYSQLIGIALCASLVYCCTLPLVYIDTPDQYLAGFTSTVKNNPFGKPGKLHLAFCVLSVALFAIPKVWAKRTNFTITGLNLAWAMRNFFAVGLSCRGGICPTATWAIYALFISSILIFVMSLLPKLELKN